VSRLAVDPAVLAGAGVGLIGVGEGLVPAVAALCAGYNANTGQDAAGVMFGRHYADAGRGIMASVATGINALLRTGYGVQVSAVNYSRAEAYSDLSGRSQPLESPSCPVDVSAAGGPSAVGGGVGEPALWVVVELLVGDFWPSGSPTQMRLAAGAWRSFASPLYAVSGAVASPYNSVGAQEISEGESIKSVIREIEGVFGQLGTAAEALATAVEGFAADVENTQNAIRRLLDRLGSIGSIVGMFFEFVRGHGEQELHEIAADIRTVLDHLKSEADAKKAMFDQALRDVEALSQVMQIAADREFKEFFGEDVGNVLSGLWRSGADIDRGLARWTASTVEGIEDLNPARAFYDPQGALQTWKGLAQMAQVVTNPAADPELTKEIVKGLVRVDEWKTQRPLTALTENLLDVGTAFLGPEAAAGGVAKVGELGDVARVADMADGSRLTGALGKLGEIPRPVGALDEITTRTGQLSKDLETTALAPTGGKPVSGPVLDKPAATPPIEKPVPVPTADKPAAAPVGEAKPVGGKPVPPDKPSNLPASPVESRPAPTPEATAAETAGVTKASVTDTSGSATNERAAATPTSEPAKVSASVGVGKESAAANAGDHPGAGGPMGRGDGGSGSSGGGAHGGDGSGGGRPEGPGGGGRPEGASGSGGGDGSAGRGDGNPPNGDASGSVGGGDHPPSGRALLHGNEPINEHWHHIPDGPDNPHYGDPLENPAASPAPGPVTEFNRRTWELVKNPDELYGHDAQGHPLSKEQYDQRYRVFSPDGRGVWDVYPPNDGAVAGTRWSTNSVDEYLEHFGADVDRIGESSGKYLGVMEGGVPAFFEERGLPMGSLEQGYYRFRFTGQLPAGWTIEVSEVVPAFGRDGGALQLLIRDGTVIQTIDDLVDSQVLEVFDGAIR